MSFLGIGSPSRKLLRISEGAAANAAAPVEAGHPLHPALRNMTILEEALAYIHGIPGIMLPAPHELESKHAEALVASYKPKDCAKP